uniref:Uncharacterized protein n=1 Tax=Rhizophora mucronata TaxID=61149 RepID=A0A2P2KVI1_RHIMU
MVLGVIVAKVTAQCAQNSVYDFVLKSFSLKSEQKEEAKKFDEVLKLSGFQSLEEKLNLFGREEKEKDW